MLAAGSPTGAGAQSVVPADEARARVVVREGASRQSRDLGALHQGGAEYLGSIQGLQWHHVRLPDGTLGFVRSARTRIVPGVPPSALPPDGPDAPDGEGGPEAPGDALGGASESALQPPAVAAAPPGGALGFHRGREPELPESVRPAPRRSELALVPESSVGRLAPERESPSGIEVVPEPVEHLAPHTDPVPRRSVFQALRDALASLFRLKTRVDFEIRNPSPGQTVHQHREPNLPVSGYARAVGAGGDFDVLIVIDVSTSTTEASGADVNGDGKTEDAWRGSDSILAAQIVAAQNFVRTLSRLPGN
ncbi:MAG: SH3 domain-containing protein, partial [Myxococcota bacterium]